MYKYLVTGIVVLFFSSFSLTGQNLITLDEAIKTAWNKNPEINIFKSKLEQKSIEWKMHLGLKDPVAGYAREGMSAIDPEPFDEQRLEIKQELSFPLTSYLYIRSLKEEKSAMELELKVLKNKIKLNVKRNYIDVLYAIYLENLRKEELKLARELYEAVKLRKESGASTEMDLLQAELNLSEASNRINDADRTLHNARYALFNSMGLLPSEQSYEIDFQDSLRTREDLIDQEEALNTLENQPEYISKTLLIESQESRIKAAKSEFLPDISIGYLRQDFGTGYSFNGIEGGLSIPIWGALKQKGGIEKEKMKKNEIQWNQTTTLLDLKKRIEFAWHSYENSKVILERFNSDMRLKAEKLQALSLEAYRLGQLDLLKLIEAQRIYLRGQERYLTSVHDYYLRLAELEYFMESDLVF